MIPSFRPIVTAISLATAFGITSSAICEPSVANVRADQRAGTCVVDVLYDLTGATSNTRVAVVFSPDNGTNWSIIPTTPTLTGDAGLVTASGVDKHIVWDAGTDYPQHSHTQCKAKVIAVDGVFLPGNVPLELVYIPPGTFTMGSPEGELSRQGDETQFDVQLTSAIYMGKTELTQKQWLTLMDNGEPWWHFSYVRGDDYPAYNMSYLEAQAFNSKLSSHLANTGQGPALPRLPTEAEWEYACRAGTTTRFSFGNGFGADDECSTETERTDNMWYCGNNAGGYSPSNDGVKAVAQKLANPFGLYDMHGNVCEWCQDWYGTYPTSPPTQVNPTGPVTGTSRVTRGGSFAEPVWRVRSAERFYFNPSVGHSLIGFRVVIVR